MSFLKNNLIYHVYFKIRYVLGRQNELQEECAFYNKLLIEKKLMFDVGANHGDKTAPFSLIANKVIAFEPDKANVEFLNFRFRYNKNVTIEDKAVSSEIGTAQFYVVNPGSGLNTIDAKRKELLDIDAGYIVSTTTLDAMIQTYGTPDFIKIDVEGHEIDVLSGLSHPIKMLAFEANLPEFIQRTLACLDIICDLDPKYMFNYGFNIGVERNDWLSLEEIKLFITSTDLTYLNIYCNIPSVGN